MRCSVAADRHIESMTRHLAIVVTGFCLAAACNPSARNDAGSDSAVATKATLAIDTVARGLDVPWAIAFAPDGRIFVSERVGRIRVIEGGTLRAEPWATLPVAAQGEAGLMGIALAPDFATTRELFAVATFDRGGTLVN